MTRRAVAVTLVLVLCMTGCRDTQPPEPRPSYPRDGAVAPHAITPTTVAVRPPTATTAPVAAVYDSCDDVRAADADPITTTDPGWNPDLDRDHDGTACE